MFVSMVLLILGLALLIVGADLLIRGVTALAMQLGVPAIVVGMTVVAFGTSTPEVAINLLSAIRGESALAFGNVVGSCSINLGWVLALTAIIRPLRVEAIVIRREMPFMILATAMLCVLLLDELLGGAVGSAPGASGLSRGDGVVLLLLFGVFIYYTVVSLRATRRSGDLVEAATDAVDKLPSMQAWKMTLLIVLGLIGVAGGAQLSVGGAVDIARAYDVPENIIGLTLVSFGTTLPELVTCVMAARRGQPEIAIGNVVGSNILNVLLVGGAVATIQPIAVPPGGTGDLAMLGLLSLIVLPIALRGGRIISRAEGALLLMIYLAYISWRLLTMQPA